jgi:hypothetical protein
MVDDADRRTLRKCLKKSLIGTCYSNNIEVFRYLLNAVEARSYKVPAKDILTRSLQERSKDVVEHFVAKHPVDITSNGAFGLNLQEMFVLAAGCNSVSMMNKLQGIAKFSVNCASRYCAPSGVNNRTALSCASDPAAIRFLLDAKADVNPKNYGTVLQGACEQLRPDAVKMLLEAGAGVNHQGIIEVRTALHFAVYAKCTNDRVGDKIEVINVLLDAGANTRGSGFGFGCSVLHVPTDLGRDASYNLDAAFTAVLARDPRLVHCRNHLGSTPLLNVLHRHQWVALDLTKVLIDAEADVNTTNIYMNSACSLSLIFTNETTSDDVGNMRKCLQLMLAAGANPTVCTVNGETLLMQLMAYEADASDSDWDEIPESGFCGGPAFLADIINAVAYPVSRKQGSSSDARTDEATEPVERIEGDSEVGYMEQLLHMLLEANSGDCVEVSGEKKVKSQSRKRRKRK